MCAVFQEQNDTKTIIASRAQIVASGTKIYASTNTVTMTLTGLVPFTNYTNYCTTQSVNGLRVASLQNTLDTAVFVSTACCKVISVTTTIASVSAGGSLIIGFVMTSDALPKRQLSVAISYAATIDSTQTSLDVALFPANFLIRSISNSLTYTSTITTLPSALGLYNTIVTLTGASVSEYNVSFATSRLFQVRSSGAVPFTPSVNQAQFTDDGTYAILTFDTATNRAKYTNNFPCVQLLSFVGMNSSKCVWFDSRTIHMYPIYQGNSSSVLAVGSTITIKGRSNIRAYCSSLNSTYCVILQFQKLLCL